MFQKAVQLNVVPCLQIMMMNVFIMSGCAEKLKVFLAPLNEICFSVILEKSKAFPPCIRLIDQTDSNKLYVVTIDGAFLGWSSKCDVCLKENDALADVINECLNE